LDVSGGVLSFSQLGLDAVARHDWSVVTGNPAKLGIAVISVAFDVLFMYQHYVLYSQPTQRALVPAVVQPPKRRPAMR